MKIGFFGVGHMGGPMAANLVKAGHEVAAFDLVPALLAAAVNDGVKAAESAAEAVQGADVIVNSLHPATYMDTGMVRRAGLTPRATVGEGADAVMQLITSSDIGSGGYFNRLRPARANAQAYDEEARAKLWRLSEELTGTR